MVFVIAVKLGKWLQHRFSQTWFNELYGTTWKSVRNNREFCYNREHLAKGSFETEKLKIICHVQP